ncbi:GntR family transcriptional regulator [Actinomadura sp. NPDC048394]|uniref:GntR family transcriptional regulator n=1 Tax=Actinomadura sp. NPDC048394 TaxID=3158223 RepID=UPI0033EEC817
MSIDMDGPDPLYVQIADILETRIAAGTIGRRLPSVRTIAQDFGVAHATAAHAVQELTRRGLVKTTPGRGTFVQRPADGPAVNGEQ